MRARGRLLLLAFWILPALVATLGLRLVPSRANPDLTILASFAGQFAIWFSWGLWSLVILAIGDRFPFERGRIGRALAAHGVAYLVVVSIQIFLVAEVTVRTGLGTRRGLESTFVIGIRQFGDIFTVIFWAIVGAHVAFQWHSAWRSEAARSARLGEDLARAQLAALQSQLNPHFLFNALNSVVTLIGREPGTAQRLVVRLADLLRGTLQVGMAQELPLAQELDVTGRYLEIEQVRFADRLTVEWEIEPDLGDAAIPALALQPLVENAIVHGIARRPGGGTVWIRVSRQGDQLRLVVTDDGPGPQQPSANPGAGVGLTNLRSRLERLYGGRGSLTLEAGPDRGAVATLTVPFHRLASPRPTSPATRA
ncbi:MAG: histidine kinase [Gemmatimonadales bacterium]|nr:histidine kinase [Gemmatimonadales bacterium]